MWKFIEAKTLYLLDSPTFWQIIGSIALSIGFYFLIGWLEADYPEKLEWIGTITFLKKMLLSLSLGFVVVFGKFNTSTAV